MEATAALNEFQKARELRGARRASSFASAGLARPVGNIPSQTPTADAAARPESVVESDRARAREFRERISAAVKQKALGQAAATVSEASSAVRTVTKQGGAWVSWALWAAAFDNIIDTFGLSLLILPIFHVPVYAVKILKFPGHAYLWAPGDDGLIGQLPPPRIPLGMINRVYGLVNIITLGTMIAVIIFALVAAAVILMLPLILFAAIVGAVTGLDLGPLLDYIKIIFSL